MKIALIGATGFVGGGILSEALERGHSVLAIVRKTAKLPNHSALTSLAVDIHDAVALASAIASYEVVISAFNPGVDDDRSGTRSIIHAAGERSDRRLLVVGGAGSLEVAPGTMRSFRPSVRNSMCTHVPMEQTWP